MTTVLIHSGSHHGRCSAFWASAVHLGLLRPVRMCPLTVLEEDLRAFADGLDLETIRAVNARLTSHRRKPAQAASPRRGRRPGSGFIKHILEDREAFPGAGGTGSGAPAGVAS